MTIKFKIEKEKRKCQLQISISMNDKKNEHIYDEFRVKSRRTKDIIRDVCECG